MGVESWYSRTINFLNLSDFKKNTTPFEIPTPTPAPDHLLGGHNELNGTSVKIMIAGSQQSKSLFEYGYNCFALLEACFDARLCDFPKYVN